ncbi:hypothetical protein HNQ51_001074 [Inhella inkyongensis]|uniref:Uncharacterized protein n=1 Tax=Inhella inkyongensis TaxID=392593 RepID=A0A840S573_9BURK|nr:hypothetical protein [Inhella inkyongensis]
MSGSPRGLQPRTPTPFLFVSPKRNGGKRKATPMRSPSLRLGSPPPAPKALSFRRHKQPAWAVCVRRQVLAPEGTGRNALRSLRSLRLNGRPEPEVEVRWRARPQSLRFSAAHRGPRETERPIEVRAVRYSAVGCWGSPYAKPSSAGAWGSARSAPPQQTRRGRSSEASLRAQRVPRRPQDLSSAGNRSPQASGAGIGGRLSLSPFLFGEAKRKGSGCGVEDPTGSHQKNPQWLR